MSGNVRSGTTLLNLYLAAQENSLALGEIQGLFEPVKKDHLKKSKELKKQDERWKNVIEGGKKNLYKNLFTNFPEINLFIDSSKDPFWIDYHSKENAKNASLKHVLTHKTLEELAKSFSKRDKLELLEKVYVNFHRRYFSVINDFIAVSHKSFVMNKDIREKLCNDLELPSLHNRKKNLLKNHPNFFGSDSFQDSSNADQANDFNFRYNAVNDTGLINFAQNIRNNNKMVPLIERYLAHKALTHKSAANDIKFDATYNQGALILYKIWEQIRKEYKYAKLIHR